MVHFAQDIYKNSLLGYAFNISSKELSELYNEVGNDPMGSLSLEE